LGAGLAEMIEKIRISSALADPNRLVRRRINLFLASNFGYKKITYLGRISLFSIGSAVWQRIGIFGA